MAGVAAAMLVLAGCGQSGPPVPTVAAGDGGAPVPSCDDVPAVQPPAEHLRDDPIYVGNEQPVEALGAWAHGRDGFEELWIDRDHLGWVVLGFSDHAEAAQDELSAEFPGVGAVVVEVERTLDELLALQRRVHDLDVVGGSWASVQHGVVGLELGALTDDKIAAVQAAFGDQPVCITGTDPAVLPQPGPQAQAGPGWRLLADEVAGEPYRTGVAADPDGYERLWRAIGLPGQLPTVDFETEIVVWFGAVFSSSCPGLRFDGVVHTGEPPLLHAVIVDTDDAVACNADANPRAFVVAVERAALPDGPFAVQLGAQDPPPGAPQERTLVDADLRSPGAPLPADAVGPDPALAAPAEPTVGPGEHVEVGFPVGYRFNLHCGPQWLGPLNDVLWRTGVTDTPQAWRDAMDAHEEAVVEVIVGTEPPVLTATVAGHALTYHPTADEHPGCD
ncbi:hypothetical protein [Egicoccus sp. AB-alg6-2]|uniref:hypothetical protein n=1 Tax=Egicoccus sp. AB-alg6-2 TaxID=3242692 RepID=UPI00359EB3CB